MATQEEDRDSWNILLTYFGEDGRERVLPCIADETEMANCLAKLHH